MARHVTAIPLAAFVLAMFLPVAAGCGGSSTVTDEVLKESLRRYAAAVESGDLKQVRAVLSFQEIPCMVSRTGIGFGPECPPGAADGTSVPSIALAGGWSGGRELDEYLTAFFPVPPPQPRPTLYGIYRDSAQQLFGVFRSVSTGDVLLIVSFDQRGMRGLAVPRTVELQVPDDAVWLIGGPR